MPEVLFLHGRNFLTAVLPDSASRAPCRPAKGLTLGWYSAEPDRPRSAAALCNRLFRAVRTSRLPGQVGFDGSYCILAQEKEQQRPALLGSGRRSAVAPRRVMGIAAAPILHARGLPQGLRNGMLCHLSCCTRLRSVHSLVPYGRIVPKDRRFPQLHETASWTLR